MSWDGFIIVTVVALAAPLIRAALPAILVPALVLEFLAGMVLGPSVLGWIEVDEPIEVFSTIGVAMLLFLAGKEIRLEHVRGAVLRLSLAGTALSIVLAVAVGLLLVLSGLADAPVLIAIGLVASSLSVIIPPLRDSGQAGTPFGQLVLAAASMAEIGAILLVSFTIAGHRDGFDTEIVHLAAFVAFVVVVIVTLRGGARLGPLTRLFGRLQDTSAQIRVRASFALVAVSVLVATSLGFEAIFAAFTIGLIIGTLEGPGSDVEQAKTEAIAFGVFVPFFFVAGGLSFDLGALFEGVDTVALIPIFFVALLVIRMSPALLYRKAFGNRMSAAAGLFQSITFTVPLVISQVGPEIGAIGTPTASALVGAGLLSVIVHPAAAVALIDSKERRPELPGGTALTNLLEVEGPSWKKDA